MCFPPVNEVPSGSHNESETRGHECNRKKSSLGLGKRKGTSVILSTIKNIFRKRKNSSLIV